MNKTNKKAYGLISYRLKSYGLIFILAILLAGTFKVEMTNATPTKGSITIRKFDVNSYENLKESTGQASDEDNLPSQTIKLADVEFKVEKLLVGAGVTNVTPATSVDTTFTARIKQTDSEGVAIFADLPLGYYLVTESIPTGYTSPEDGQFIIAIPIVTEDANGTKTANYDVVVFPKNQKNLDDNGLGPIPPGDDGITPTPLTKLTTSVTPSVSIIPTYIPTTTLSGGHTGAGDYLGTSKHAMSAKTGDLTSITGFIILMIASSGIVMGIMKKRRSINT